MSIMLETPISPKSAAMLSVGDMVEISGNIFCGRDAVLPKICDLIDNGKLSEYGIDLEGSVIFHTAVSIAGLGPTSSNKYEIESSFLKLSEAGVRLHLGKGEISEETVFNLERLNSVYAVIPPVTALLTSNMLKKEIIAFPELGMEAFYRIEVKNYSAIIAAAHGKSIY